MAVKIKLKRMGKIRSPHYRVIVADSRARRDGRAIEEIGLYNPTLEPSLIKVDSDRAQHWLSVGAQPTEPVLALLKVTGDWQKFKGLPGAEGTLKVAEPKADKRAVFDAALADVHGEPKAEATTAKKKPAKKSSAKSKADEAKSDEAKSDDAKADEAQTGPAEANDAKAGAAKTAGAKKTDKQNQDAETADAGASASGSDEA